MYEAIARSNHFLSASNAGGVFMGKGAAEMNIVGSLGLLLKKKTDCLPP